MLALLTVAALASVVGGAGVYLSRAGRPDVARLAAELGAAVRPDGSAELLIDEPAGAPIRIEPRFASSGVRLSAAWGLRVGPEFRLSGASLGPALIASSIERSVRLDHDGVDGRYYVRSTRPSWCKRVITARAAHHLTRLPDDVAVVARGHLLHVELSDAHADLVLAAAQLLAELARHGTEAMQRIAGLPGARLERAELTMDYLGTPRLRFRRRGATVTVAPTAGDDELAFVVASERARPSTPFQLSAGVERPEVLDGHRQRLWLDVGEGELAHDGASVRLVTPWRGDTAPIESAVELVASFARPDHADGAFR